MAKTTPNGAGSAPFILDFHPPVGLPEQIVDGVRRLVAPNASPMTFRGTNTYLLGEVEIAVIDPGPDDPAHLQAILDAVGAPARISHILVTHSHVDHSPLARRLSEISDAPVLALGDSFAGRSPRMSALAARVELGGGEGVDHAFAPDIRLEDGTEIMGREWRLQAIATPGHFSNHMCFADAATHAVFTGDHVMSWATTLVSPPDGDLSAFMASLEKMRARTNDRRYYPGHGAPLEDPQGMIRPQIAHRLQRESQILEALANGPATPMELARRIYTEIDQRLIPMAARNVFSHLIDMMGKNRVSCRAPLTPDCRFSLQ